MAIKIIKSRNAATLEEDINTLLSDGYKLENTMTTGDMKFIAILSNGIIKDKSKDGKLDVKLINANKEFKKNLEIKAKELSLLQDNFSDMQEKYADAIADGEKLTAAYDNSLIKIADLKKEIEELKKENTYLKGQNTKLKNKIEKLIAE